MTALINAAELAKILKVSARTLARWRDEGTGPKWIKLGTAEKSPVRYNINDVEAWLLCQEVK